MERNDKDIESYGATHAHTRARTHARTPALITMMTYPMFRPRSEESDCRGVGAQVALLSQMRLPAKGIAEHPPHVVRFRVDLHDVWCR